jgi:hypothetical protein
MLNWRLLLLAAILAAMLAGTTAYVANVVENPKNSVPGPTQNYGPLSS